MRAALIALLLAATTASAQELTVQREWRVLVVGLGVGEGLDVPRALERARRGIERELPGLRVRFEGWRDVEAPADALGDDELVAYAVREAEAAGLEPADFDVTFVLSPLYREPFFGYAHIDVRDRRGRSVRGGRIQTAPGRLILDGVEAALREGAVDPALAEPLRRLLEAGRPALERLLASRLVREAAIVSTLAHELGHFLAPGDLDVRDGYDRPWLRHATSPEDNPEGHGLECVMFKGRSLDFYLRKVVAMRGRLVRFCDACRTKLGCH
jgi:hypothetical protein